MSRNPRLQDRRIYPHWSRDTVRFCDQDAAGHVNNVAICAYLETGRLTFVRDAGLMHQPPPLRAISAGLDVSFLRESHWPGDVEIGCGVLSLGTSSIRIGSGVFKDGACIATAEMTIVRLNGTAPHPLDAATRQALEALRLRDG
ncbi:acyl-CoA thioesterase [Vineibacter terrae]|uniref:Acyl-CoA thioesterase n=1 Tax=Vineibacter terrae TaxID=2586908 RepID=A0A5C8PQW2_9HYPH|nr:acyl-CoA thioesterase [Vineibacter terrae]TXL77597.1 acyl-CoA thioesterase [Vineibacter terrae]